MARLPTINGGEPFDELIAVLAQLVIESTCLAAQTTNYSIELLRELSTDLLSSMNLDTAHFSRHWFSTCIKKFIM